MTLAFLSLDDFCFQVTTMWLMARSFQDVFGAGRLAWNRADVCELPRRSPGRMLAHELLLPMCLVLPRFVIILSNVLVREKD